MMTSWKISKVVSRPEGHLAFHIDRKAFLNEFFRNYMIDKDSLFFQKVKDVSEEKSVCIVECDKSDNITDLSSERIKATTTTLMNIFNSVAGLSICKVPEDADRVLRVGCAAGGGVVNGEDLILVGPVLNGQTKKKDTRHLVEVLETLVSTFDEISRERDCVESTEADRKAKVEKSAKAELQFQLLSSGSPNQAVIINSQQSKLQSVAVLYNYARIIHIRNANKISLPDDGDGDANLDFGLLKEPEEWELVFVYLSRYRQVLEECVDQSHQQHYKLGKLPQFLAGLAKIYSRYYNRIRVLKSPEQRHLHPTMFARLYLLQAIGDVIKHGLGLMDIEVFNHM